MDGKEIKKARLAAGLSQGALAGLVKVTQGTISSWETGRIAPPTAQIEALAAALAPAAGTETASPGDAYGDWLRAARQERRLTRDELAAKAGVSKIQIYNIETGRTASPRDSTRGKLQKALRRDAPEELVTAVEEDSQIQGVGRMSDFDPHSDEDFPREPGVYVFYDISDRPIYVGKSNNIRTRIRGHVDKFWYRSPIVHTASYVRVDDEVLRGQLEETLIKFLKSNAVINQQHVDR